MPQLAEDGHKTHPVADQFFIQFPGVKENESLEKALRVMVDQAGCWGHLPVTWASYHNKPQRASCPIRMTSGSYLNTLQSYSGCTFSKGAGWLLLST